MDGEPDIDGDGVPYDQDADEQQAFRDAQHGWVSDAERIFGPGFIQIANGESALIDSTLAARIDGMFYEQFPGTAFGTSGRFRSALDSVRYNNLWAARDWPRRRNGGPWLILSQMNHVGYYRDENGAWLPVDAGELTRALALLTGGTAVTYDDSGRRSAGIPDVEYDLGAPLGPVQVAGDVYRRAFEHGRIELYMGSGDYPEPFDFQVLRNGRVIQDIDFPTVAR
jgi:hypothetical protein